MLREFQRQAKHKRNKEIGTREVERGRQRFKQKSAPNELGVPVSETWRVAPVGRTHRFTIRTSHTLGTTPERGPADRAVTVLRAYVPQQHDPTAESLRVSSQTCFHK